MAATHSTKVTSKRVLMLGAGYVSAPVVEYLTRDPTIRLTICSSVKSQLDGFIRNFPRTIPAIHDVIHRPDELDKLVKSHDLVISLLPHTYHPEVARVCIKHHKNLVTASYNSSAMLELNDAAKKAEITIVNEVGVDPGIDHMLAMECFDEVRAHGGKILSFESWCGGLPAPEFSNNPLRYKFNWSPMGVLMNTLSQAKYLQDGKVVEVSAGGDLIRNEVRKLDFLPGFNLEGFPNRDSMVYKELYNIPDVHTMVRGTLRYQGFSEAMQILQKLQLIDSTPLPILHPNAPHLTWKKLLCEIMGKEQSMLVDSFKDYLAEITNNAITPAVLDGLGLLDDERPIGKKGSPIDTLCYYLSNKIAYAPGETDVLIMRHTIGIQWPDRSEEKEHVDFVIYGNPDKYSAMSATVGFPTAIAAKMVLDGEIQEKGIVLPMSQDVYRPILKRLELEGIKARQHRELVKEKAFEMTPQRY